MKKSSLLLVIAITLATTAFAQNPGRGAQRSSITMAVEGLNCTTSLGGFTFPAMSWSFGATDTLPAAGGSGGVTGKVSLSDLMITKRTDSCSPALFTATVSGRHFRRVTLIQQDTHRDDTFKVTMEEVIVSSYQIGGTERDEVPSEQVAFHFSKICFEDTQSGAKACYDLILGR